MVTIFFLISYFYTSVDLEFFGTVVNTLGDGNPTFCERTGERTDCGDAGSSEKYLVSFGDRVNCASCGVLCCSGKLNVGL